MYRWHSSNHSPFPAIMGKLILQGFLTCSPRLVSTNLPGSEDKALAMFETLKYAVRNTFSFHLVLVQLWMKAAFQHNSTRRTYTHRATQFLYSTFHSACVYNYLLILWCSPNKGQLVRSCCATLLTGTYCRTCLPIWETTLNCCQFVGSIREWTPPTVQYSGHCSLYSIYTHITIHYSYDPEKSSPRFYAKSPTARDVFWPIPGLICAGMTRRWGLSSYAQNAVRWLVLSIW